MRKAVSFGFGISLFLLVCRAGYPAGIEGDYLEARSADVYTGPCFANGEVGLRGNQAILAWKVRQGTWNGVSLDGLAVVAVVRADATLGDQYHDPYPAQSALIIDQRASEAQKGALTALARSLAGRLLENVVAVRSAPISMETHEHGSTTLKAGDLASVSTRSLSHKDHFCGNEITYYPPLITRLSHSMPVVAVANEYSGASLGSQWRLYNRRSAFVGTFQTEGPIELTHAE